MHYAQMVDMLEQAKLAGKSELTYPVNELLGSVFDQWLETRKLSELTDEEYDALLLAFEEGYGIRPACPCRG